HHERRGHVRRRPVERDVGHVLAISHGLRPPRRVRPPLRAGRTLRRPAGAHRHRVADRGADHDAGLDVGHPPGRAHRRGCARVGDQVVSQPLDQRLDSKCTDRGERMPGRLAGKVALISGTAGGQGRRAAVHFAAEGAKVVGCDVKVAEAEETVEMVRAAGGEMVSFQPVDLTEEAAVEGWIESAVQAYGDFDILYNNAAVAKAANLEDVTRADWDWNMANEVTLVYLSVKHALPVFERRGGGVILNVGSIAGMIGSGMPGNAAGNLVHCVAKAAVIRLT